MRIHRSASRSAWLFAVLLSATTGWAALARAADGDAAKPASPPPAADGAGATGGAATASPPPSAAPAFKLEPGASLEIACDTRAVSVADEAKATTGRIRLKLEAPAAGADAAASGRWTVLDVPASHAASFALQHRDTCAGTHCPLDIGAPPAISLWAPAKVMPEKLQPGQFMSLIALDLDKRSLRASSFRDNAIAALEQGDCEPAAK